MAEQIKERIIYGAQIFIGEGLMLDRLLGRVFEQGALLVVYDQKLKDVAEEQISFLKHCYNIFRYVVPSKRSGEKIENAPVEEFVRHVLAVGAGSAASEAKRIAGELGVEWSLFMTAPSTDAFMCGKSPKAVFIDKNVLIKCPIECIAAGYGILLSQTFSSFESFFDRKVLGLEREEIDVKQTPDSLCELALCLLEISSKKRSLDSADILSCVLYSQAVKRKTRPRLLGEYKTVASCALLGFYSSYLASSALDVMPPPVIDEKEVENVRDIFNIPLKTVDFFDLNGYFKISYILSEYRMDLLTRLSKADVDKRFFRRLYPDAGYALKKDISCRDVSDALPIAGAMSDGLLGYAFATGVLSKTREHEKYQGR